MKRYGQTLMLLAGCWIGSISALATGQEAQRLTLEEALALTMEHQPQIQLANEGIAKAKSQLDEAKAGLLPRIALTGGFTYNGKLAKQVLDFGGAAFGDTDEGTGDGAEPPVTEDPAVNDGPIEFEFGTRRDYRATAQLNQTLFDWGRSFNGLKSLGYNVDSTMFHQQAIQQMATLRTTEAFYGLLLTRELMTVAEKSYEQAELRKTTTELRVKAGTATRLDQIQANVALSNANAERLHARNVHALAQHALALAIGLDPDARVEAAGALEPSESDEALDDFAALSAQALENRPDLKEVGFQADAAEHLVKMTKSENKPTLAATGTYAWTDTEKQDPQTTWSVGLGISFPIFNGFAVRARQAGGIDRARGRTGAGGVGGFDCERDAAGVHCLSGGANAA